MTLSGSFCFAVTLRDFIEDCDKAFEADEWVSLSHIFTPSNLIVNTDNTHPIRLHKHE